MDNNPNHGERPSRRRRAPTTTQRRAANVRERQRMYNLNEAFRVLRQSIPTFAYEKRLSRIETLRLTLAYISFLTAVLRGEDPDTVTVRGTHSCDVTGTELMASPGGISAGFQISSSNRQTQEECEPTIKSPGS